MEQQRSGFWATVPGLLTGAAALITAATGGYLAFDRTQKATAATAPDTPAAVEPKAAAAIAPATDAGMAKPLALSDTAPAGASGFEAHAPAVDAAAAPRRQARPSFDCARASTAVEMMVCSDAELADRDRQVAQQYFALRGTLPPHVRSQLLQSQRQFLQLRSDCPNSECLSSLYDVRLRQLAVLAAN